MVFLANDIEEYKIIQPIAGIGGKIAATIISEIGEIDRFNHPKKLVAFAGIDPSVHSHLASLQRRRIGLRSEVPVG